MGCIAQCFTVRAKIRKHRTIYQLMKWLNALWNILMSWNMMQQLKMSISASCSHQHRKCINIYEKWKITNCKNCILCSITLHRDKCIEKSLGDFAMNCYFLRRMHIWIMGLKGTFFFFYSTDLCIVWIIEKIMYPNIMYLFKTIYTMTKIWPHDGLLNGDLMFIYLLDYLCLLIFYFTTTTEKTGY